ncbi:MAG: efflux RND transporter permease subunit, partial [Deltaproteobacteria bacterium]|nr:efflux RND transporter permease subunit [Deltaproteobacteria bacterium]
MSRISMAWVFVIKPYPGVPAEEIEKLITIPIEEEIQDIDGIESISSQSSEGSCFISVKFEEMNPQELRNAYEDVRAEVDKVQGLPEDALDTMVNAFSTDDFQPIISAHLHGKVPERKLIELGRELRDELRDIPNISKVDIAGDRQREIWVEADPLKLEGYGVSLDQIQMAIAAQGVNIPGGKITSGRKEVLVSTVGEFGQASDIKKVIVRKTPVGGTVRVADLASITSTYEEERTRSRLDGDPVVTLSVTKNPKGNTIDITDEVKRLTAEFVERHGNVVDYSITQDTSEQINDILSKLSRNAGAGFVIVLVVLLLVIGARNAILAAIGIPISFLACFIAMHRMGESFNGNSLFGLVLVLGIIVDDAIIIVENCYRHRQLGKSWREAAIDGTNEVTSPVLSATGTTIAAFLPLMLLPGLMGQFMRIIPIALTLALLASMIEAFFILPAHLAEWPGRDRPIRPDREWVKALQSGYERALRFVIRRRKRFAFVVVPILLIGAGTLIGTGVIGVETFAGEEINIFQVRVQMPVGTSFERTSEVLEEIEREVQKLPDDEIRAVHGTTGRVMTDVDWVFRTDVGEIWIDLPQSYDRERTTDQIIADLRARLAKVSGPTSIELAKLNTGPPLGKPVEVKVKGVYYEQLEPAAEDLKVALGGIVGVVDIGDDFDSGKQEIRLRVDPERAALHGLTVGQVGLAVRNAVEGAVADTMYDGDEEIDIVVRVDEDVLERPEALLTLPLLTPMGTTVSLGSIAGYELRPSISQIRRYKLERTITVYAEIDEEKTSAVDVNTRIEDELWPAIAKKYPGLTIDFSGEFQEFKEAFVGIVQLFAFGVLLMFGILATQFRSYIQPLVILATVPLAFIGATLGLLVSGNPFSLLAGFGLVALAGIAVNDAIVLVSFINNRKREGTDGREAVIEGSVMRLRPVILTSITTMAGLLPMAVGLGGMSLTWGPMANTIVWGIGVATLMTLFMIPALYTIVVE